MVDIRPDKRAIAQSFSRSAATYDAAAELQRHSGTRLWQLMQAHAEQTPDGRLLDVGCGTGHFTRWLASQHAGLECWGLDLAEGMVREARARDAAHPERYLIADIEALPFANCSFRWAFANLSVQWSGNLPTLIEEVARCLQPGGHFGFTTLVDGTLDELQSAWRAVDDAVHVNRFHAEVEVREVLRQSSLNLRLCDRSTEVRHYASVLDLTQELKQLGAHNLNPGRPRGLSGRRRIRRFVDAYEHYRGSHGRLPATYQFLYVVLHKG